MRSGPRTRSASLRSCCGNSGILGVLLPEARSDRLAQELGIRLYLTFTPNGLQTIVLGQFWENFSPFLDHGLTWFAYFLGIILFLFPWGLDLFCEFFGNNTFFIPLGIIFFNSLWNKTIFFLNWSIFLACILNCFTILAPKLNFCGEICQFLTLKLHFFHNFWPKESFFWKKIGQIWSLYSIFSQFLAQKILFFCLSSASACLNLMLPGGLYLGPSTVLNNFHYLIY